ncbi:hypothetical protein [Marinobacterium mangrovicola]|uniref:Uncharacterized protein n=1 Tax=Marinobacterium mangrovicola TaxID=1476959 RepID=A0A4R1GVY8_9GAMM|nr:hypothetical protein [Marinobacterium mangrovicola]TCK08552.1 hypothetical protein CLV83_0639 [Marinobacterium mangrovicola]
MGTELTLIREMTSVCATASEWDGIARTVNTLLRSGEFNQQFNQMVAELNKTYLMLDQTLSPFAELDSEQCFTERFDTLFETYRGRYLLDVSQPRKFADETYEIYLLLKQSKEISTNYPLLKRTFIRLDEFIDKWVTNDAWLAMSIDTLLKMLNRFFGEIAEMKRGDSEEAFLVYDAIFAEFRLYLTLLEDKLKPGKTEVMTEPPGTEQRSQFG